ncbi:hypothetical protein KBC75_02760 [Candidatus Shapirobacteria bacterium]|nr:hypothetical protein [Candidatus Shapirobacteria bacterium]
MKKLIPLIFFVILILIGFKFYQANKAPVVSDSEANLILFWGEGCSHCEKVKQHISDNKLETKIKIAYKEVYYNKANQKQLETTIAKCPEIDTKNGIGVPVAFDPQSQKCISGDEPIISWLNAK